MPTAATASRSTPQLRAGPQVRAVPHAAARALLCLACFCLAQLGAAAARAGDASTPDATPDATQWSPPALVTPDMSATALPAVAPFDPGELPAAGRWRAVVGVDVGNDFRYAVGGGESLLLDVETRRSRLQLLRGLGDCWALGLQLTHIDHGGGDLDQFIVDWHDVFGLPQHGRDDYPSGRFDLRYERHGELLMHLRGSAGGAGDTLLSLHRRESCAGPAWQFGLKLPSGEADELTGSGAADGYLGAVAGRRLDGAWASLRGGPLAVRGGAWLALLGEGDLPFEQRRAALFLGGSLHWRALPRLQLDLQLGAHSPLYRSALRELGGWSLGLALGGHLRLPRDWLLAAAVVEDLSVESTADVVLQLALRRDF